MAAYPPIERLVIASHNEGKVREIRLLLAPWCQVVSAKELGLPEPEETGTTFEANALLKARAAAAGAGLPALADDSGIEVAALDGAPGVYTADWAGEPRDFARAMARVNDLIGDNPDRRAAFVCCLALAWPDGPEAAVEGRIEGTLVWPPRGSKGFGFDPMFVRNGEIQTFGEIEPAAKHADSHRSRAFAQLVAAVFERR